LRELDADAKRRGFPSFYDAPAQEKDAILANHDDDATPDAQRFLRHLISATLEGVLGDPTHGGNRDAAGWSSLGLMVDSFAPSRMT
jgi:gluconate 2-dehydrogenase gamma chain